jgi:hypothetical protein
MRLPIPTSARGLTTAVVAAAVSLSACGAGASLVGVHDAPAQVTTTGSLSAKSAESIATRVMTLANQARTAPAEQATPLRTQALTGSALAVAEAAAKLGAVQATASSPVVRNEPPKVLAISRGTSWPRLMLVQSTGADDAAVLNLLTTPDAATPFKLAASATMHPGAEVAALDSLQQGSPAGAGSVAGPTGAKVAIAPKDLVSEYAASLAFPKPAAAPHVDESDPFSSAVRANAAAQARSFGKLAALKQQHLPQDGQTVTIALKGGGALVFTLLQRVDTITLSPGGKSLTPSAEFQKLVGKKTLTKNAELKSYETVVFTVPVQGKASVVAVDEALVSAKGA